jgi:VanZ family protein
MKSSPALRAFPIALAVCVLAIAYLAFAPLDQAVGAPSDKLNHILAFAVLSWLAEGSFPGDRRAPIRWTLLMTYGLVIEIVQAFLPYREFSLLDVAADGMGILLYSCFAWAISRTGARNFLRLER